MKKLQQLFMLCLLHVLSLNIFAGEGESSQFFTRETSTREASEPTPEERTFTELARSHQLEESQHRFLNPEHQTEVEQPSHILLQDQPAQPVTRIEIEQPSRTSLQDQPTTHTTTHVLAMRKPTITESVTDFFSDMFADGSDISASLKNHAQGKTSAALAEYDEQKFVNMRSDRQLQKLNEWLTETNKTRENQSKTAYSDYTAKFNKFKKEKDNKVNPQLESEQDQINNNAEKIKSLQTKISNLQTKHTTFLHKAKVWIGAEGKNEALHNQYATEIQSANTKIAELQADSEQRQARIKSIHDTSNKKEQQIHQEYETSRQKLQKDFQTKRAHFIDEINTILQSKSAPHRVTFDTQSKKFTFVSESAVSERSVPSRKSSVSPATPPTSRPSSPTHEEEETSSGLPSYEKLAQQFGVSDEPTTTQAPKTVDEMITHLNKYRNTNFNSAVNAQIPHLEPYHFTGDIDQPNALIEKQLEKIEDLDYASKTLEEKAVMVTAAKGVLYQQYLKALDQKVEDEAAARKLPASEEQELKTWLQNVEEQAEHDWRETPMHEETLQQSVTRAEHEVAQKAATQKKQEEDARFEELLASFSVW